MGFLKKLLGNAMSGGHHGGGGGRGNKHGGGYGYSQPVYNNPAINQASGKNCPGCNAANLSDARFCQQCGAALAASNCSQCHSPLLPDAKFCQQCGKPRA